MSCPHTALLTGAGRVFHDRHGSVEFSLARLGSPMESMGRLFLCATCRVQVVICSDCDCGQIYCPDQCALRARRESVRAAGRRYQSTRRGRHAHAERARRYRAQRNKVTHQGSPVPMRDVPLGVISIDTVTAAIKAISSTLPTPRCHFCGCACSPFVRIGPLRHRVIRNVTRHPRGIQHDRSG